MDKDNNQIILKIEKQGVKQKKIYILTIIFMISLCLLTDKAFIISSMDAINNLFYILVNTIRFGLFVVMFGIFIREKALKEHYELMDKIHGTNNSSSVAIFTKDSVDILVRSGARYKFFYEHIRGFKIKNNTLYLIHNSFFIRKIQFEPINQDKKNSICSMLKEKINTFDFEGY